LYYYFGCVLTNTDPGSIEDDKFLSGKCESAKQKLPQGENLAGAVFVDLQDFQQISF